MSNKETAVCVLIGVVIGGAYIAYRNRVKRKAAAHLKEAQDKIKDLLASVPEFHKASR